MKLKGKVAVITGGSRGIGAAIASRLAREGASVAIVYKARRDAADAMVAVIRKAGGQADAFRADVSDEEQMRGVAKAVAEAHGRIDVLVNSAGIFAGAPVGQIPRELFDEQFRVNTWSVVAATQAVLPYFPSSGGAIVNVSTSLVHRPIPASSVYSASKAAVDVLTLGFALELGPRGIRVNGVAPAVTRTDMTAGLPAEVLAHEISLTPLGRLAEPGDIADVAAFLASDDARWVTGRTLLADGGRM